MQKDKGFSLVELLVVVVIIGVIAVIAIPNLIASRRAANESSAIASLRTLFSADVTFAASVGNGDFAGDAGAVNSSSLSELRDANLIDSSLAGGSKGGYKFVGDRVAKSDTTPASFYLSANPINTTGIERTGNRRFGVSVDGVIKFDSTYADLAIPFDTVQLQSSTAVAVGD